LPAREVPVAQMEPLLRNGRIERVWGRKNHSAGSPVTIAEIASHRRDSSDNAIPSNKHTRLADVSLVWRVRGLGVPRPPLGVKTFILRYLEADVGPLAMRLNWPPSAATPRDRRYRAESGRLHRFGPCFMAGLVLKPGLAGSPARKGRASTAAGARGSLSRAVSSSGQTSPTIPLDVRHDGGAIQDSRAAT
jgi:hypothetical protein